MNDHELLRRYLNDGSQGDFAQLVERHVNLVYSAANRLVHDPHLAEDVVQQTFVLLARKAGQLGSDTIISAWLYRTARHLASETLRREGRRLRREQLAVETMTLSTSEAGWPQIAPLLDEAMTCLNRTDHDALVLRYFENKSLNEVGEALGFSDDTAQKRVSRAVEKLRTFFAKRGVTVGASGLVVVISANAVQAAPVGLAVTIATTAAVATAATAITTTTIATTMNWINLKSLTAVVAAAVTAGTATHFVQQREANRLRKENQQFVTARDQLTSERDAALAEAANGRNELARLQKNQSELLRLRGEVGVLRKELSAQANRAGQQPARTPSTAQPAGNVGAYLSKEQLAFAGYATPEAAFQSVMWVSINGTFEDLKAAVIPNHPENIDEPREREKFENEKKTKWAAIKGMQIMAKKLLADDKAELKLRLDVALPERQSATSIFVVQPMAKVGNEWKASASGMKYQEKWERDGQIQTFTQ